MNLLSLKIYKCEIKISNQSTESVAKFRHLRVTPTDQNCICKEIKSRWNSGTDWCHAVKFLLSPFLSKNVDIKVFRRAFCLLLYMNVKLDIPYWGSVQEKGAEEDIWDWEGGSNRRIEKTT